MFVVPSILWARLQRQDYLDNCDWCKEQAKYTQPLDLGEWRRMCQRKLKPIWFNYRNIGKVYGTYKEKTSMCWMYSQKLGWIYNTPEYKDYIYTDKFGWLYMKKNMVYFFKDNRWDYLININS
jgi:hypothetical protein